MSPYFVRSVAVFSALCLCSFAGAMWGVGAFVLTMTVFIVGGWEGVAQSLIWDDLALNRYTLWKRNHLTSSDGIEQQKEGPTGVPESPSN